MAVFFLHQRQGPVLIRDLEGVDLPDAAAARAEAILAARELMSETLQMTGLVNVGWRFEIEDEQGNVVDTLPFGDAIDLRP